MDSDETLGGRTKRQKTEKAGRFTALERLRQLKGQKNKVDVGEIESVYEVVDEDEYSKRVQERQTDDFIQDDDGLGYVEDGREIFDDDLDEESLAKASKSKKGIKRSSVGKPDKGNIKNMLMAMPKKKEKEAKLDDDSILGELMQELQQEERTPKQNKSIVQNRASMGSSSTPSNHAKRANLTASASRANGRSKGHYSNGGGTVGLKMEDSGLGSQNIEEFPSPPRPVKEKDQDLGDLISDDEADFAVAANSIDTDKLRSDAGDAAIEKVKTGAVEKHDDDLSGIDWDVEMEESSFASAKKEIKEESEGPPSGVSDIATAAGELPMVLNEKGEKVLRMYWLDAYEDPYHQPGTVFLFGKVWRQKDCVSCCLQIKGISRRVFVLRRSKRFDLKAGEETEEEIGGTEAYKELNEILGRNKVREFRCRPVEKKYAFEVTDVPNEADYMEVKYSATYPALPSDLVGETFSHVFGTNTSSLEMFLLDLKIKGPCWLDISGAVASSPQVSWCAVEAVVQKPESVSIATAAPSPPVSVLVLDIKTAITQTMPKQTEIVLIGCLSHNNYKLDQPPPQPAFKEHFATLRRPSDMAWPLQGSNRTFDKITKVEKCDPERQLLNYLLAKIQRLDPDIIVGHDISGYYIEVLLQRLEHHKVPNWSRLGRLRRGDLKNIKAGKAQMDRVALCGRLLVDVKHSAQELIRSKSYDLPTLRENVLRDTKNVPEYDVEDVRKAYNDYSTLCSLIDHTMQDATDTLRIMNELQVLQLATQITCVAGNVLSRTLVGGRSERNEFLLLHAFNQRGYIVPDKRYGKPKASAVDGEAPEGEGKGKGRRKAAYAGGLVLDPKTGFYDKMILLMDFNSLYPSIIQEYNICFTTVPRDGFNDELSGPELLAKVSEISPEQGVLPTEIGKLVSSRREVKKLLKDPKNTAEVNIQLDIRQKALKLMANSMYGCLGFTHSRFYAKPIAALITAKGREILMQTKTLVQNIGLEVVYGDTDSIMINSNSVNYQEVIGMGARIKQEVNKSYKHLELEVDGVFKMMLLLKKKKYAALIVSPGPDGKLTTTVEHKGLDIVRRDWSPISVRAGHTVIDTLFSEVSQDERSSIILNSLQKISEELRTGTLDLDQLMITKQLTKNPEEYADKKSLPHVQVALRLNTKGGKKLCASDTISYIICEDGSQLPAMQRAYHPDELKHNQSLKPDVNYYLSSQVYPVVMRLLEPVEEINSAQVASTMGLDASIAKDFRVNKQKVDEVTDASEEEKFRSCRRLTFKCRACGTDNKVEGLYKIKDNEAEFALYRCVNQECSESPLRNATYISNVISMSIRSFIDRYYKGYVICEDPSCNGNTRQLPLNFNSGYPVCSSCSKALMVPEYSDTDLYRQILFYRNCVDISQDRIKKEGKLTQDMKDQLMSQLKVVENGYCKLKDLINTNYMEKSAYCMVDLGRLFAGIYTTKPTTGKQ